MQFHFLNFASLTASPLMIPDIDPEETESVKKEPSEDYIAILLLAAGSSSRMGRPKQLLDIHGTPLLRHSVEAALGVSSGKVVVVLGSNENAHRNVLKGLPVDIVVNHYWKDGMGSSIKTGLHYIVQDHGDAKAILIMVCDQPALTSNHLNTLIDQYRRSDKKIVASSYHDTLGVPVVFGRSFFSNILMLRDDQGAKKIIEQFSEQVMAVPFAPGAIDLDTMADYNAYLTGGSIDSPSETKKVAD